jgi:hypothetical protein
LQTITEDRAGNPHRASKPVKSARIAQMNAKLAAAGFLKGVES